LVRVTLGREELDADDLDAMLLAVADCGNDRVQLFDPDGVVVGEIWGRVSADRGQVSGTSKDTCPRHFSIAAHPLLVAPQQLSVNGSVLEIQCAEGEVLVDLGYALLLDHGAWADSPERAARKVSAWLT